ncbi:hypothetical protein Q9290_05390 [Oceanimonas sp. CHS3-5]|uniref:hypothetical protein n=1 Tax=Oceanimonas sp. CHS3-5 TaxID=3068186 RepID=UPI00273E6654|nr:hypothetical protein [Oceanimonas sp. CHS3-5]MDP5291721.1 hypothetical protein [Oceanimonas sp. CHS3-5]
MNTSAEVDEQQREKATREQVMIHELKEAPLVYEWNVTAAPPAAAIVIAVFSGCLFIFAGIGLAVDHQSFIPVLICTSIGLSLSGFVRYLWISDKHYHYQLTPIGIRYTIQDAIPETAYQVVRAFAWVGVFVCILAVGVLGPLALVGAGGMAFLAFGMTNFSSEIREDETYFSDNYEVRVLRSSNVFSIESEPFSLIHYGQFFCEKGKLDETLNRILPYLKNYTIKEIKSYRDL